MQVNVSYEGPAAPRSSSMPYFSFEVPSRLIYPTVRGRIVVA